MKSKGFTLVELAIVIVIIGLLVGGVLQGQELIKQAQFRRLFSDLENYKAAMLLFRDKFSKLPGDLHNAEAIWGSDSSCPNTAYNTVYKQATCNGNGDNIVANVNATPSQEGEMFRFWQHLANAKLIKGAYTGATGTGGWTASNKNVNVPTTSFDALVGIISYGSGIGWWPMYNDVYNNILLVGTQTAVEPLGTFLEPADAFAIDSKFDDGKPGRGNLRTRTAAALPNCSDGDNTQGDTAKYVVSYSGKTCNLFYMTGF